MRQEDGWKKLPEFCTGLVADRPRHLESEFLLLFCNRRRLAWLTFKSIHCTEVQKT